MTLTKLSNPLKLTHNKLNTNFNLNNNSNKTANSSPNPLQQSLKNKQRTVAKRNIQIKITYLNRIAFILKLMPLTAI